MNGRQRNATNAQIWGKKNDSNYDGSCTARRCLRGTYEISGRWIFVRLSVQQFGSKVVPYTTRSKSEFVKWYLHEVHDGETNPTLILFSDAA